MKKTVSVLLSVLLVATAIFAGGVIPALGAASKAVKTAIIQDDFSSPTAAIDWGNNTAKSAEIVSEPGNEQNKCVAISKGVAHAVTLKSNTKYLVSFKLRSADSTDKAKLNAIMATVCEDVRTSNGTLIWNSANGVGGVYDAARPKGDPQKSKDKDGDEFTCPGKWEKWGGGIVTKWENENFSFETGTVNPNKQYFVYLMAASKVLADDFTLIEITLPTGELPAEPSNKVTKTVLVQDDFNNDEAKADWGNNTTKAADIIAEPGNEQNKCVAIKNPAACEVYLKSNTRYTVNFKIRGLNNTVPLNGIMVTVCEDVRTSKGTLQWNSINGVGGVYDAARPDGDPQKSKDKENGKFTCPGKWQKWGSDTSVNWIDCEFTFTTGTVQANKNYYIYLISVKDVLVDDFVMYQINLPQLPEAGQNGLLRGGDFSATYEGQLDSVETIKGKTDQVWVGTSKVVTDPTDSTNSCVSLKTIAQYCPGLKSNTEYFLTYRYKNNPATAADNANFWVCVVDTDTGKTVGEVDKSAYKGHSYNKWETVKAIFKTGELAAGKKYALSISAPATGDRILLDDVGLYEKADYAYSIDVDTYRGGKAAVSTPYANAGDTVTFTATNDETSTFVGWLIDGNPAKGYASKSPVYRATVSGNLKLVAEFKKNGYNVDYNTFLNGGAESGDLSYWKNRYPEKNAQLTVDSTEKHSGNYSFKLSATEKGVYYVESQYGILLQPNCEYTVSVWVKTEESVIGRSGIFTGEFEDYQDGANWLLGNNNFVYANHVRPYTKVKHTVGTESSVENYHSSYTFPGGLKYFPGTDDNGWTEIKTIFTTSSVDEGLVLNFALGTREDFSVGSIWFDDLTVTCKALDISTQKTKANYCEWNVNNLFNGEFETTLAETDVGEHSGWQIVKDSTAPEQESYLKINAGSGVYVKEMTVKNIQWSVLGTYLKTNKAGSSYIGLTSKQPAQNADFANPESLGIYCTKPTTSWERTGWKIYADGFTKVWVVIYSGSNDLYLDQLQFFNGKFAYESNPNDTTPAAVYDYEGNGVLYDNLDAEYKAAMQQTFGVGSGAPVEYDSNTAATGDEKPVLPAVFILLSCAAVCALALRKGKVTNEK